MSRGHEDTAPFAALPRSIGPYVVEGVLGQGGMGVVHRAIAPDGSRVALKTLLRAADPMAARRFVREGLVRIEHPNVVRVLDAGVDARDGTPFIAFELLEGETLADRLARRPLSASEAIVLGRALASGLGAAHARGVVHRDLKPTNVFLTKDGAAKLLDFGIARLSDGGTVLTRAGFLLGTPTYMSPEQARGVTALTPASDLWSLGAVLYEAVTGVAPFARASPLATMLAIVAEDAPLLAPGVPELAGLARVIARCLTKSAADRYPDAEALLEALSALDIASVPVRTSHRPSMPLPSESRIVSVLLAAGADLEALADVAEEHRGELTPILGDVALVVFGARAWLGDEISHAARVALAVRARASAVAIASGRISGTGGGVDGEVLERARAGLVLALPGVALDAPTAQALGRGEHTIEARGSGFELLAPRSTQTLDDALAERPLVGRDAELAQLSSAVRTVLDEERPWAVLVVGSIGTGKSALRRELERLVRGSGRFATVLHARGAPGKAESLSLFADLLVQRAARATLEQGWPEMGPTTSGALRMQTLVRLTRDALPAEDALEYATILAPLLDASADGLGTARSDPQLVRDRMRVALTDYVVGLAARGPLALVLEDLHWTDAASLELLEEILLALEGAPVLTFATTRPELLDQRPALLSGRDAVRLSLRGLSRDATAQLAESISGRPLPAALGALLFERTSGNPLFVEQIVSALAESSRLDDRTDELPVPLTVEAAVQSRLDALPVDLKEAAKDVSVLAAALADGRDAPLPAVAALGVSTFQGSTPAEGSPIDALVRREILLLRARPGGRAERLVSFRSAIVADVAYRMLAPERRTTLHERAARFFHSGPHADAARAALHYDRAGLFAEARERYGAATLAAARRGDASAVLSLSDRALALDMPEEGRFALHLARADARRFEGRRDAQQLELGLAEAVAASEHERAQVAIERAMWLSRVGRASEARDAAERALGHAREASDAPLLAMAYGRLAEANVALGRIEAARDAVLAARTHAPRSDDALLAQVATWRALVANAEGDVGETCERIREATDLFAAAGDLRRAVASESNLADAYNRLGQHERAVAALEEALVRCRRVGHAAFEGYIWTNLAYARTELGRVEEARQAIDEAEARAAATRNALMGSAAAVYRARLALKAEPPDVAVAQAERAAKVASEGHNEEFRAQALVVGARALLLASRPMEALALAEGALAIRDALGGLAEAESELYLVLAQCLDACARGAEADAMRARGRERVLFLAGRIRDAEARRSFVERVWANSLLLAENEDGAGTTSTSPD